jgi:hypothetical protein
VSAVAKDRQARIPRTTYMLPKGEELDASEIERRTVCQCERPNVVVEPRDGTLESRARRYCLKCGREAR